MTHFPEGDRDHPGPSQEFALPSPRGPMPIRRAPGARRTSTIDVVWPEGRDGTAHVVGTARDIETELPLQPPRLLGQHTLRLNLDAQRRVLWVEATPPRPALQQLVGISRVGELRGVLRELADRGAIGPSPLYQLVDDVPGVMVAAGWAWSQWPQLQEAGDPERRRLRFASMEGVCAGFAPHSSALRTQGEYQLHRAAPVPPLPHPRDSHGWHHLPEYRGVSFRRARCIEVWVNDGVQIEAMFQDSATTPEGTRAAVHEYTVRATSTAEGRITSISAIPHILPFP